MSHKLLFISQMEQHKFCEKKKYLEKYLIQRITLGITKWKLLRYMYIKLIYKILRTDYLYNYIFFKTING